MHQNILGSTHTHFSDPDQPLPKQSFWGHPCWQSPLRWLTPPHCQHTGHPVLLHSAPGNFGDEGALTLTTCSLAGGLVAAFAASSLRACMRALFGILPSPTGGGTSPLSPLSCREMHKLPPYNWGSPPRAQQPICHGGSKLLLGLNSWWSP
jgi:hypothetical protein